MKSFLFVIQFDSFAKTLIPVIQHLVNNNYHCDVILLKQKFYKKPWLSNEILSLFDNLKDDLDVFDLLSGRKTLQAIKENDYSVVTVGTTYTFFIEKVYQVIKNNKLNSKIATGYVGALLNNNKDGFIKGVRRRSFSNLVWVPGQDAKEQVLSLNLINLSKTKVANTGLPRFDVLFERSEKIKKADKNNIVFFEQPTFPKTKKERVFLVQSLINLARVYNQNTVIIKTRFDKKIGHAHRPKHLLQDIFYNIVDKPKNIIMSNEDIYDLFNNCMLSLTISSTAGLESLACGIPTYFINDFCRGKNLYGSDDFKKFNALLSFKDLYRNRLPKIDFSTINDTLRCDGKNTLRLANELILLSDT